MSLPQKRILYTPEEYLEFEREAETRHEYVDGEIYEMAGESLSHSRICVNLAREVSAQLRGSPCEALSPNMKVRTSNQARFSYPDLSVVCGQPVFHDDKRDVLLNPTAVFEVLSPSTEKRDRGEKFMRYRNHLETLSDYVLVAQHVPVVEHYSRQENGDWMLKTYIGLNASFTLPNINCTLRLRDIYDRVEFPPPDEEDSYLFTDIDNEKER